LSNASLEFQYAYAQRNDRLYDSLIVLISTNCGSSWERIYAGGPDGTGVFATHELTSDFWPEVASDWCLEGWGATCLTIDLTAWAGNSDIKLAFESYSDLGNPLFIDNVAVSQYVGVNQTKDHDLSVFPNPTNGALHVNFGNSIHYNQVEVLNQFGQVVYRINTNEKVSAVVIPDLELTSGMYFVVARGSQGSSTVKVISY
jgi:hypothetical protein